jgi:hypothetical protein
VATEACTLRKTQEEERLAAINLANAKQDPKKIVTSLLLCTQDKGDAPMTAPSIKPKPTDGLSMVKMADPETDNPKTVMNWMTVTDQLLVEQKIITWNQRHFGQAGTTPLATAEMQALLSFGGTSSLADQLLFQKLDPSHITPDYYGQQLLANKCSLNLSELNSEIMFDNMQSNTARV